MFRPQGPLCRGTFAERRAERKGKVDAGRLVCRHDAHAGDRSRRRRPFPPILPVLMDNLRAGGRSPRKSAPGRNHPRPQRHARAKIWISSGLRSWTPQLRNYAVFGGWIDLDFLGFSRPKRDFSMGYSRPGGDFYFSRGILPRRRPEKVQAARSCRKSGRPRRGGKNSVTISLITTLAFIALVPANAAPPPVARSGSPEQNKNINPRPSQGFVAVDWRPVGA